MSGRFLVALAAFSLVGGSVASATPPPSTPLDRLLGAPANRPSALVHRLVQAMAEERAVRLSYLARHPKRKLMAQRLMVLRRAVQAAPVAVGRAPINRLAALLDADLRRLHLEGKALAITYGSRHPRRQAWVARWQLYRQLVGHLRGLGFRAPSSTDKDASHVSLARASGRLQFHRLKYLAAHPRLQASRSIVRILRARLKPTTDPTTATECRRRWRAFSLEIARLKGILAARPNPVAREQFEVDALVFARERLRGVKVCAGQLP